MLANIKEYAIWLQKLLNEVKAHTQGCSNNATKPNAAPGFENPTCALTHCYNLNTRPQYFNSVLELRMYKQTISISFKKLLFDLMWTDKHNVSNKFWKFDRFWVMRKMFLGRSNFKNEFYFAPLSILNQLNQGFNLT